jgi:hypothetical protein
VDSIDTLLAEFRARLRVMEASLEDASIEHTVEVGTALSAMVNDATTLFNACKKAIRDEALSRSKHEPGTLSIEGTGEGRASVTVLPPRLKLVKGTNAEVLKIVLGDSFDEYFETKVDYKPRKGIGERIVEMPTGKEKDALLASLQETEETPRVSFRKR